MKSIIIAAACAMLAACGGGGGGPSETYTVTITPVDACRVNCTTNPDTAVSRPATPVAAPVLPTAPAPVNPAASLPMSQSVASVPPWPTGESAPASGRSLNWWGTDPREVERVNATCTPNPDCVVPDGDLMIWNRACASNQSYGASYCRIALYGETPAPITMPSGPPAGMTRPDPMTASQAQADEWNRYCMTARCMVTPGVPS